MNVSGHFWNCRLIFFPWKTYAQENLFLLYPFLKKKRKNLLCSYKLPCRGLFIFKSYEISEQTKIKMQKNQNPPLDFFFSWSNMITTSITPPKREKKLRRSVSVRLDGRPPRKTLGQFPFLFCFCMLRGLQALGSIWRTIDFDENFLHLTWI